jgi:hypothetical protein
MASQVSCSTSSTGSGEPCIIFVAKKKQSRPEGAQQFLERPLVAELAPQHERLLIKLLRSGRHVGFNH